MKWYLPEITIDNYANIKEVRNSRLDWGEFEAEKKYLLAIADVLGERWEAVKPFLHENKLDSFDQEGFVFLWFRRYMPEVFAFNPWMLSDLLETIKVRNSHEYHKVSSWLDFSHFNIAFNIPDALMTTFANAGHDSSLARLLVQRTLFWCYDYNPGNEVGLIRALNDALHKGYTIGYVFELLILLCGIPKLRSLIEHVASTDWASKGIEFYNELKEFLEGKRNILKRKNPMLGIINHVMSQVFLILMDATSKYVTYDINQKDILDRSGLLSMVKKRFVQDIMNKNYYVLERSVSGDVTLSGVSR